MEFCGSVAVGARVAETIRTKIIDPNLYKNDPAVLMLGMTCAVIGSSTYVFLATKLGLPVSTTHSIMGGVIGMGFATVGARNVRTESSTILRVKTFFFRCGNPASLQLC
jgi:phosphate/sulfate permease